MRHHVSLGSVMALTDDQGMVVATNQYDIYGEVTGSSGNATTPYDFAGEQTDASTGLQYLRARYMDPATGTFIWREPLASARGWLGNPTAYAAGNSCTLIDPTGMYPVDEEGSPVILSFGGPNRDERCLNIFKRIQGLTNDLNNKLREYSNDAQKLGPRGRVTHRNNIATLKGRLRTALHQWTNNRCGNRLKNINPDHAVFENARAAIAAADGIFKSDDGQISPFSPPILIPPIILPPSGWKPPNFVCPNPGGPIAIEGCA